MIKRTRSKLYNTEKATLVRKVTYGTFGDPTGYEKTLFQTPDGDYFLYTFGGAASDYPTETITAMSPAGAEAFLKNN